VHRFEHADQWTKEFDDPARDAWQKPAAVIELMEIDPGDTVADVGAGTGYFEPYLSRAVGPSGTVLALDIEADMVKHLTDRAASEKWGNVKPALVRTDDPLLPAAGVDRILIVDTWHHIPKRKAYAAKLAAALAPGGRVFVVDFTMDAKQGPPHEHRVPPDKVAGELVAGGLQATIVDEELPDQYVVVGKR
jgi:ubiquinone/menaquinone biosynthesis C-methylase UbiE